MKVLLMTLVLVLLLAGCAAGQSGAGRTPTEETTANGAEETTVNKEETTTLTGMGGFPRPPDSTLSYGGQEVRGQLGSYCWSSANSFGCADSTGPPVWSKQKALTVPSGSEVVFRYGGQSPPKTIEAGAYFFNKKGQLRNPPSHKKDQPEHVISSHPLEVHGSGVERPIPIRLPQGEYILDVSVEVVGEVGHVEDQNGATYYFHVMVE
jgi:hypothetical protein